ncbi:hypothetical protein [Edaphobacter modestus]|uniref:YD repeat-containing protein n=1 Tax=Edaphobacter modestus TaxID=388466 RepID=A0A4Q7YUV8_9BACT|nr:hypothetical protein [Edaphobacter modestus]RZU41104.1 hypothetical protein BDD14_2600 [Edaphobacter modestus]
MKVSTVRDGQGRILGNTTQYLDGDTVARDRSGSILGRSSRTFGNTRGPNDRLVSNNKADARLLFRK